jgi:hypothetical protein
MIALMKAAISISETSSIFERIYGATAQIFISPPPEQETSQRIYKILARDTFYLLLSFVAKIFRTEADSYARHVSCVFIAGSVSVNLSRTSLPDFVHVFPCCNFVAVKRVHLPPPHPLCSVRLFLSDISLFLEIKGSPDELAVIQEPC